MPIGLLGTRKLSPFPSVAEKRTRLEFCRAESRRDAGALFTPALRRFVVYSLEKLGWSEFFSSQCKQMESNSELVAARVAEENREMYRLLSATGEFMAEVSGKFRHEIQSRADFPGVGDWVLAS